MKILLSNDDGFESSGLKALYEALLAAGHKVLVVAPDRERSGASMAITLTEGVSFFKKGENLYSCSGTPVDCVFYALLGAVDFKPDLVLGGINRGPNLGADIVYSGTCAVARQAAMAKIAGIAVSSNRFHPPFDYERQAKMFVEKLDFLLSKLKQGFFLNVNFPASLQGEEEWLQATLSNRYYEDSLTLRSDGKEVRHYFLQGNPTDFHREEPDSDWVIVEKGKIAYTLVPVS